MPPGPGGRRTAYVVAGLAGGLAVLLVGGVVTWVALGPAAPYASAGDCDDLLAENVLAAAPGAEDNPVERLDPYDAQEEDVEEVRECLASDDPDASPSRRDATVSVAVYRHSPETREDHYSDVQKAMERGRDEFYDFHEVDVEDGEGTASATDTGVEMEVRRISVGDGGDAYFVETPDEGESLSPYSNGRWGSAAFTTRNLAVYVTYSGTSEVTTDEHMEVAVELARAVNGQIARTVATE